MSYETRVEDYVHGLLEKNKIKKTRERERAINYSDVGDDLKFLKDRGLSDDDITREIMGNLRQGMYLNEGVSRKFFRKLKQGEGLKVPSSVFYSIFHPFKSAKRGLRKLFLGYDRSPILDYDEKIKNLEEEIRNIPNLPFDTSQKLRSLKTIVGRYKFLKLLEKENMITPYKAKRKEDGLEKAFKGGLEAIIRSATATATAVVLIFLIGVSLLAYSLFKPSVTGYVVLESGQNVSLGIIFGVAFIIVAFGFLYIKKILKNKK